MIQLRTVVATAAAAIVALAAFLCAGLVALATYVGILLILWFFLIAIVVVMSDSGSLATALVLAGFAILDVAVVYLEAERNPLKAIGAGMACSLTVLLLVVLVDSD
jgi:hypothetical protein